MKILFSTLPPTHALRLRLLSGLELTRPDGTPLGSVLTQPKRLALLAFLALSTDGGFLRRDVLLDIFWPDFDQERARAALRKALYFLRRSLGDGVIIGRGDEELGVDRERLWCDALAFQAAVSAGHLEDALELYRGDLLGGFFVAGQPDFEKWLEAERTRLRLMAARVAEMLADRAEENGDPAAAVRYSERALELDTVSEPAFRRVAGLLYRQGDRARLAHTYGEWRTRLVETYGIEPAGETQRMVASLLAATSGSGRRQPEPAPDNMKANAGRADVAPVHEVSANRGGLRPRRLAMAVLATCVVLLVAGVLFVRAAPSARSERVLVGNLENDTGDSTLDHLGRIAADWIAHGLMMTGSIEVISTSSALFSTADEQESVSAAAQRMRAGTVVSGRYYLEDGALRMQAQVIDAARGRLLHTVPAVTVSLDSVTTGAEQLRQRVAAALAARFNWPAEWTELTRRPQPPTYDAYVEYVRGWDLFSDVLFSGRGAVTKAAEHFERAWALDTTFHLARLYATLMYVNMGQLTQVDSVLGAIAQRRERLAPYEKLLLEHFEAVGAGDTERAFRTATRLNQAAPNSLLAGHAALAVATNRPRAAIAAQRDFDASRGLLKAEELYWRWFSTARHMLGDYRRELKDARRSRLRSPELMGPLFVEARALAGLGRTKEVERLLEQTHALPKQDFTPGAVMLHTAVELRAHGHREAAARVLGKAFAWHEQRPPEERQPMREILARTLYEAGRYAEARTLFEELHAEQPGNLMRLGYLGTSAARLGDRDAAERISDELAVLKGRRGHNIAWRARIASVLGEKEQALSLLRDALSAGLGFDLWVHMDADLDPLRTSKQFREMVRPKD